MEQIGEDGIFVKANVQPFANPLVLWFDSLLLGRLVDALLGSTASEASDGPRTFTRLEKHLIDQLAARLLGLFASSYAGVRKIGIATAGMKRPSSEDPDWIGAEKCVSIHATVSEEETSGSVVVLLPFPIFADDFDQLSVQPEAQRTQRSFSGSRRAEGCVFCHAAGGAQGFPGPVPLPLPLRWDVCVSSAFFIL